MNITFADHGDLGITRREVQEMIDHPGLSHDVLSTRAAVEAHYQPLTVSVAPPTILSQTHLSPGYAVEFAHHFPDVQAFAEYVDITSRESVLDLGTGLGWVLQRLRQIQIQQHRRTSSSTFRPPRFIGVDASQSMLALARCQAQAEGVARLAYGDFQFVHNDMSTLQSINDRFDVITCRASFQHLPRGRRQPTLVRWKSLLAPGGRIVFDFQGNTPIPLAADISHARMRHPSGVVYLTRAFIHQEAERAAIEAAYRALLATAGLKLDPERALGVAGINNHNEALARAKHYAATGGGYDDQEEVLEALEDLFHQVAGRRPDRKEKFLLVTHYMGWLRDEATASQPSGPQQSPALLHVKNLALIGTARPVEKE